MSGLHSEESGRVAALNMEVSSLKHEAESNRTRVVALEAELTNMQAELAEAHSDVERMQSELMEAVRAKSALDSQIQVCSCRSITTKNHQHCNAYTRMRERYQNTQHFVFTYAVRGFPLNQW